MSEVFRERCDFSVLNQEVGSEAEVGVDHSGVFEKESAEVGEKGFFQKDLHGNK